jgi:prophage regulatory protein
MAPPGHGPHTPPSEFGARFARIDTVVRVTGLCRATIYRLIAADKFPAQVRLGTRAVGWRWSDLERWSAARPTVTH